MHQCIHCQADLADNAQFCGRCGTPAEEIPTRSVNLDEAHTREEELETTSKQPAIAVPATPALPTLRTRRMHPKSSISEFPQTPWLPAGAASEDEGTTGVETARDKQNVSSPAFQLPLTPPIETLYDSPQTQAVSTEPETSAPALPVQPEESFQPIVDTADISARSTTTPDEISTSPDGDLVYVPASNGPTADEVYTSPTGELEQIAARPRIPDAISASPTNDLTQMPTFSASTPDEISAAPTGELKYASPFPPPTPERKSTPRPASTMAQSQRKRFSLARGKRAGSTRVLIVAMIVVLVVLIGGAGVGAFALAHQNASAGTTAQCNAQQTNCAGGSAVNARGKPTHLTFSGTVAGPMLIVAKPICQISSAGNLRALTVNLSGTINGQLYNLGFVIEHYNGPGTYSNTAASTTILFDVPGQSTTNGWGNSAPTDNGSITVARGEQTGTISYTLSGVGTQANTQIQTTGTWTCGN